MRVRRQSFVRYWALALALAGAASEPAKAADDSVTLLYYERAPLHYTTPDNKPAGFIVDATERLLTAAGIPFTWVVRPAKRVLNEVFEGAANVCSPGWFLTDDRENKVLYSDAFMTAPPLIAVVNDEAKSKASSEASKTLAAMGTILVRDHLTRGSYLDRLLSSLPPDHVVHRTTTDVPSMLATVAARHADMAVMTEAEADYYLPQAGPGLSVLHFTDSAPEGRYLICSRSTPPSLIERINAAIR